MSYGLRVASFLVAIYLPTIAEAQFAPLTFRYEHYLFEVDPDEHALWRATEESWTYLGEEILPPPALRIDGDNIDPLPEGIVRTTQLSWDEAAIRTTLQQQIASLIDREPGSVTIRRNGDDLVEFEGVGLLGREVDLNEAAHLTVEAMQRGVTDIILPMHIIQPEIVIEDSELLNMGISEVIAIGESDFRGSPNSRQHNISVGLDKFNGQIIAPDAVFSFNSILGPVNAATGYLKELVIKGDKTLPDYGGGLCQVSTTAYRGAWEYGFPIDKRKNHSYSVRYYSPEGTDATIYPPYADMRFTNDSPTALLIQTYVDDGRAYFIYYGTKDDRESEVLGPFVWAATSAPADKVEYTTDLPPGVTRKVGGRVPGLRAAWFRIVERSDQESETEGFYSLYEARPSYIQIGVAAAPVPVADVKEEAVVVTPKATTNSWINRFRRPERRQR